MLEPKSFEEKCRFWAAHAAAKEREDITFRAYCKRHGLSLSSFCQWRRRLAKLPAVPASPPGSGDPPARLLPVTLIEESSTDSGLSVVTGTGQRIAVATGFDPSTLKRLLAVLERPRP